MSNLNTNWTKEEFKTYILLYCAHVDLIETEEEKEMIKSAAGEELFLKMHKEFDEDNDYQSLEKMKHAASVHEYDKDQLSELMGSIEALFSIDGHYDRFEKYVSAVLKKMLD